MKFVIVLEWVIYHEEEDEFKTTRTHRYSFPNHDEADACAHRLIQHHLLELDEDIEVAIETYDEDNNLVDEAAYF